MKRKNGEYRACLKYSVPTFVEQIYKMQRLEVSGAVRLIYRSLGVKGLMKHEFPRQIFEKYSNIKFEENRSSDIRLFPCVRIGERLDRQHEATR